MPVSRMRMRPWLENKIESNTIAGLVWVDKEKNMFSIPWKHAARHGWEMEKDACLFKQWALHTGKFKGETKPDPKTWKANFRCAMNSLPDIEEVKDKSINKGCGAVRVYRMLQVVSKKTDKKSKTRDNKKRNKVSKVKIEDVDAKETHHAGDNDTYMHEDTTTQENTVDSTEDLDVPSPAYVHEAEVPDWVTSVEIGPDSTNDIYSSFQVSPIHSTDYEDDAIIEITEQLERDHSQWQQIKGFLSNEVGTTESYHSPESQWSENSGDELELRFYTELIPGLPNEELLNYTDIWNSNSFSNIQQHPLCPL